MTKKNTEDIKSKKEKVSEEGKETIEVENGQEEEIPEESENGQEEVEEEIPPLEKAQMELAEMKDKYLRLYSEFENFRRRTAKERLEFLQTANAELMTGLLPVLDDWGRAENAFAEETEIKAVKEGVDLIATKFRNTLKQQGLKEMDTKEGSKFDADLHDAITQIPAPKKKLKGKIVDTIEKGYYLGEKVIRHAKVVIGN